MKYELDELLTLIEHLADDSQGGGECYIPGHSGSNLHKLLVNTTFIGKTTYKGEVFDGEQPAIVPMPLWKKVQYSDFSPKSGPLHRSAEPGQ